MRNKTSGVVLAEALLAASQLLAQVGGSMPIHRITPAPSSSLRSFHLEGDAQEVIRTAFGAYGIQVAGAPSINGTGRVLRFDMDDADLATMAADLGAITHFFFTPVNRHLVMALPDEKTFRSHFDRSITETIEIPNVTGQDKASVEGLLTNVFGITGPTFDGNRVTIRASPEVISEVRQTLSKLFRPESQVLLQIKVYTLSRSHDRNLGVALPAKIVVFNVLSEAESLISSNASVVQEIINAGLASSGDTLTIAELLIAGGYAGNSVLGSSSLYFGGGYTSTGVQFDSVTANASLSETTVQKLQETTLQLVEDDTGKLRIGERYPVLSSSTKVVTGSSSGSSASSSTPSIQYEDLGLTLEAKAHIEKGDVIVLHLHEIVRGLNGSSINNIPVLDTQEFSSDLSVPADASSVVVSNLSKTQARAIQGLFGAIPTNPSLTVNDSELVVTVTPIITRRKKNALSQHPMK